MVKSYSDKEVEELGKAVRMLIDSGYLSKKRLMGYSFLKGVASGFGAILGATIVLALFLWLLSLFSEVPFIGDISDTVSETIDSNN